MKPCLPCGRDFHEECKKGCKNCHDDVQLEVEQEPVGASPVAKKKGSTYEGLKDPQSTGRKRAARLYPMDEEAACEWRGKKNCGGGRIPIIGCLGGVQKARHHGPVKNTTRNQLGNVHRICDSCHNHWHELNDLIYNEKDYALLPHDPMDATEEELAKSQLAWVTGEMARNYELASARNGRLKLVD